MAVVDELITLLGFEEAPGSASTAKKMQQATKAIVNGAVQAAKVFATLAGGVGLYTAAVANSVDESFKFAKSLDFDIEALQELEFAAKRSGGSANELRGDIQKLAAMGIKGEKGIMNLAKSFDGLSASGAQMLGQTFGLSQGTIRLLQQGKEGIEALRLERRRLGNIFTEEDALKAALFKDSVTNITEGISALGRKAALDALPEILKLTDAFEEFFIKNQEFIKSGLATVIAGVTKGFKTFGETMVKVVRAVKDFLEPLGGLFEDMDKVDVIARLVNTSFLILAGLLAVVAIKFVAIGAAILAVLAVFDDLITFFRGGESVIGRFFQAFEDKLPGVSGLLKTMAQIVGVVLKGAFIGVYEAIKLTIDGLKFMFDIAGKALGLIDRGLQKIGFGRKEGEGDAETGGEQRGQLTPAQSRALEQSIIALTQQQQVNAGGLTSPVSPLLQSQVGGQTVNQGDTVINVNGTGDPIGVANEVVNRGGLKTSGDLIEPGIRARVVN